MSRNILLVDDHASNLRLSEMAVTAAFGSDFDVYRLDTYTESADLVQYLAVDIALLDVELPDGDGLRLAHQVRQQSPDALIVILSVRDERDFFDMAYHAGADAYITKPYNMQEVLALLQDLSTRQSPQSEGAMWVLFGNHGLTQYRSATA